MEKLSGTELIAKERFEQIAKHGYTLDEDQELNKYGQLALAARQVIYGNKHNHVVMPPSGWDSAIHDKMINKPYKERLIIAGALIAAELDRINNIEQMEEFKYLPEITADGVQKIINGHYEYRRSLRGILDHIQAVINPLSEPINSIVVPMPSLDVIDELKRRGFKVSNHPVDHIHISWQK